MSQQTALPTETQAAVLLTEFPAGEQLSGVSGSEQLELITLSLVGLGEFLNYAQRLGLGISNPGSRRTDLDALDAAVATLAAKGRPSDFSVEQLARLSPTEYARALGVSPHAILLSLERIIASGAMPTFQIGPYKEERLHSGPDYRVLSISMQSPLLVAIHVGAALLTPASLWAVTRLARAICVLPPQISADRAEQLQRAEEARAAASRAKAATAIFGDIERRPASHDVTELRAQLFAEELLTNFPKPTQMKLVSDTEDPDTAEMTTVPMTPPPASRG